MKFAALGFSLFIFFSCVSTPTVTPGSAQSVAVTSDDDVIKNLDAALRVGIDYLSGKIPLNAKVAVVAAQSPTENLSHYIIDITVMHLVNKDRFAVIERAELEALRQEQAYQASGEVSDETAVSIGHQLGVEVLVTGAIMETGGRYALRLKAFEVETARILGTRIYQVESDPALTALLKPPPEPVKTPAQADAPKEPSKQTVINGDLNITNNTTTTINGDVYINKPDWFE